MFNYCLVSFVKYETDFVNLCSYKTWEDGIMEGRLARFNSFNSVFEDQLSKHATYRQAYEATEQTFRERVGHSYYSGYDSFKNVRSRKLRKKR